MLELIEETSQKAAAQQSLEALIKSTWRSSERRSVVWRPSSRELPIAHDGRFWFATVEIDDDATTPRYWNSFGIYQSGQSGLVITVEINIPTTTNSGRVSGFFARDTDTGEIYLMHDGGVGGGRKGIGREAFLEWSGARPVEVATSAGGPRYGLLVAPLNKHFGRRLVYFLETVRDFKAAVAAGEVNEETVDKIAPSFRDFYPEFSGTKRGKRKAEFEYRSRHGEVVKRVEEWRRANLGGQRLIMKNTFVDLAVFSGERLEEIYEVKTGMDRQALYTAIGQLLVHEGERNAKVRYLVVPDEGEVPDDLAGALDRLRIEVKRYRINSADEIDFPVE